jgi:phosphoserine phosphatase
LIWFFPFFSLLLVAKGFVVTMLSDMKISAVLLDLDDTLIVEEPLAQRAFLASGQLAAAAYDLDPGQLHLAVRKSCRRLWRAFEEHDYADLIGISSWEGMWGDLSGENPHLQKLAAWAPDYRREAWSAALADFGVDDKALAGRLAEEFVAQRRQMHQTMPGAVELVAELGRRYPLIMISNGAPGIQRFKLGGSPFVDCFKDVIISGEVGVRKPYPAIFEMALRRAGIGANETIMIGNSLKSDIAGAANAGIVSVWLKNDAEPRGDYPRPDYMVTGLEEVLATISSCCG